MFGYYLKQKSSYSKIIFCNTWLILVFEKTLENNKIE
jgi:hypothetical protein